MGDKRVEVVRIGEVFKHPDADRLEYTRIDGAWTVFAAGEFKEGDLASMVPVGAMVPVSSPYFSWLRGKADGFHRVKMRNLRGIFSWGFLVPVPLGLSGYRIPLGCDVTYLLGVKFPNEASPQDFDPRFSDIPIVLGLGTISMLCWVSTPAWVAALSTLLTMAVIGMIWKR